MLRDQSQGRHRRPGNAKPGNDRPRGRPNTRFGANGVETSGGTESPRRSQRQPQQNPVPVALPEEESTQLFINIGRSRWVFPREILGLIAAKTSIPKEDIGLITILNNYSFVQVRSSSAAEMMETLNGVNFRGKTLAVNYARTRKDGSEKSDSPPPRPDRPRLDDDTGASALAAEAAAPGLSDTGTDAINTGAASEAAVAGTGASDTRPEAAATGFSDTGAADAETDVYGSALIGGSGDTDVHVEAGSSVNPSGSANPDDSADTDDSGEA
jgi:hypothetical protein